MDEQTPPQPPQSSPSSQPPAPEPPPSYVPEQTNPKVTVEEKQQHLQQDLNSLKQKPVLGAMMILPEKADFETKDQEEQVILVLRSHIITNIGWILTTSFLAILPLMALPFFPESISFRYQILIILAWELLLFGYAFERFLIWFYSLYIITNERVVDIDFHNLLLREVSDADLDKIQDVTIRGAGVMAAFFHFGDILIQTAGERQFFEFRSVPQPELVAKIIRDLIEFNELSRPIKATSL